jgi:hypothetical protein
VKEAQIRHQHTEREKVEQNPEIEQWDLSGCKTLLMLKRDRLSASLILNQQSKDQQSAIFISAAPAGR